MTPDEELRHLRAINANQSHTIRMYESELTEKQDDIERIRAAWTVLKELLDQR